VFAAVSYLGLHAQEFQGWPFMVKTSTADFKARMEETKI
jgi:hypothetical protein